MEKTDIFEWLVRYHVHEHLRPNLHRINNGRLLVDGKPLTEGIDKGQVYSGVLIVANGETLVEKLIEDRVILDEPQELRDPTPMPDKQSFFNYLTQWASEDGAHIFDGKNREIRPVYHINNNPQTRWRMPPLSHLIPEDFVHYDPQSVANKVQIGTKTRLAAMLPHAYEYVEAYQIKESPHTFLGMGKVTHFTASGLTQEFFFKYEPQSEGPFIVDEAGLKIVGICRRYESRNGLLVRVLEQPAKMVGGNIVLPSRDGRLYAPGSPSYTPNGDGHNSSQVQIQK